MASMIVFGPETTSPAAKIPRLGVSSAAPTRAVPSAFASSLRAPASAVWPTAMITASQESENSLPSMGIGLGLPLASRGPGAILMQTTLPLPTSTGAAMNSMRTPSSSASATSSGAAGISSRPRR